MYGSPAVSVPSPAPWECMHWTLDVSGPQPDWNLGHFCLVKPRNEHVQCATLGRQCPVAYPGQKSTREMSGESLIPTLRFVCR